MSTFMIALYAFGFISNAIVLAALYAMFRKLTGVK